MAYLMKVQTYYIYHFIELREYDDYEAALLYICLAFIPYSRELFLLTQSQLAVINCFSVESATKFTFN